ncbi:MAG: sel1 repeat family protein [Gammaproteobacteria bacterium]|nr:sel1 repeat family protein [Gammaproteobacteria bacterium]
MSTDNVLDKYDRAVRLFKGRRYSDAKPLFIEIESEGVISASRILGNYYLAGLDCEIDLEKAEQYYRKGAEAGDIESKFSLATIYYKREDFRNAEIILTCLNRQDYLPSYYLLSKCIECQATTEESLEHARELILIGARKGHLMSLAKILIDTMDNRYGVKGYLMAPYRLVRLIGLRLYLSLSGNDEDERYLH